MKNPTSVETPEIVNELDEISLEQICEICNINRPQVVRLVDLGVLHPSGDRPSSWSFAFYSVTRLKRACRLQRDLDLNLEGVALSLELLDEINRLRSELDFLRTRLSY
ncbi:MAG: chaperone modulator CbpM [bacterium]